MSRFAVDRYMRAARRGADLSQRELALRAGLAHHLVANAERKPDLARVVHVAQMFGAIDLRLIVVDPDGYEIAPEGAELTRRVDRRGRRFPAHLDVRPGRDGWWGDGWPMFDGKTPLYTFDRSRSLRDWRRTQVERDRRAVEQRNREAD